MDFNIFISKIRFEIIFLFPFIRIVKKYFYFNNFNRNFMYFLKEKEKYEDL